MDIVTVVLRSKKSFLLGERKIPDCVYLTVDDLDELNTKMREKIQDEKEHIENTDMFPELIPHASMWTDVNFGDSFFAMEIVETYDEIKSRTVAKLIK